MLSCTVVCGFEKPIAFASAKLSSAQMAWSAIEREAYAVIFALRKFRNAAPELKNKFVGTQPGMTCSQTTPIEGGQNFRGQ